MMQHLLRAGLLEYLCEIFMIYYRQMMAALIVGPDIESRKGIKFLLESWAEMLTNTEKASDSKTGNQVTDQLAFNILLDKNLHPLKHHSVRRFSVCSVWNTSLPTSSSMWSASLHSSAIMSDSSDFSERLDGQAMDVKERLGSGTTM